MQYGHASKNRLGRAMLKKLKVLQRFRASTRLRSQKYYDKGVPMVEIKYNATGRRKTSIARVNVSGHGTLP